MDHTGLLFVSFLSESSSGILQKIYFRNNIIVVCLFFIFGQFVQVLFDLYRLHSIFLTIVVVIVVIVVVVVVCIPK